ncbi:MAG: MinD/ParA family protein [Deltaproteobacteria bacterium]|nr:MinD/ParA family protein [Deltaproteobacteria bacterium]
MDQAAGLRAIAKQNQNPILGNDNVENTRRIRVISVTSGKGGVGKTSVVANLAQAFQSMGKRVLVLDADLGLANMDIMLGLNPRYTMDHVLKGQKRLEEVIIAAPGGFHLLPAASGIQELTHLDYSQRLFLLNELDTIQDSFDLVLIDTGAGISSNVMFFNFAAMERVVIITNEPTSLTDAYALIKVLSSKYKQKRFKVLINWARNAVESDHIFRNLSLVADKYLCSPRLDYLGWIPYDKQFSRAILKQDTILRLNPNTPASRSLMALAKKILSIADQGAFEGDIKFFWHRLLNCSPTPSLPSA